MNYIWTQKDINKAVKRLRKFQDSEAWLSARDIRSGNKPKAPDYRELMAKLVELGHAFDNEENCKSDTYRISVNWKKKEELLANLKASKQFFHPGLLSRLEIINLPPASTFSEHLPDIERELGKQLTLNDWKIWLETKFDWWVIYEILCGFQATGKLEIGTHSESSTLDDDKRKYLIWMAKEFAWMYKSIERAYIYGVIQASDKYSEKTAELVATDLFLDLLISKSWDNLIIRCLHNGSSKPRSETDNIRNLIKSHQKIEELHSKPVPEDGNERDVYEHEFKEAIDEFAKANRLLKKNRPSVLVKFVEKQVSETSTDTFILNQLLASSIPEVAEAARKWADARGIHDHLKITQKFLRSLSG